MAAADRNGIITAYNIRYIAVGGSHRNGTMREVKVSGTFSEMNITELEPFVDYNITVSASTSVGEGPESIAITLRTAEDGESNLKKYLKSSINLLRNICRNNDSSCFGENFKNS